MVEEDCLEIIIKTRTIINKIILLEMEIMECLEITIRIKINNKEICLVIPIKIKIKEVLCLVIINKINNKQQADYLEIITNRIVLEEVIILLDNNNNHNNLIIAHLDNPIIVKAYLVTKIIIL